MRTDNHIVFLCSRLDLPGGIERAITNTANLLQSKGHEITLLVLDETDACFYPVHPQIKIKKAPLHFGITTKGNLISRKIAFYNHLNKLKELVSQLEPHIIIGTEYVYSIAAKLSIRDQSIKIFSWEHHHYKHLAKSRFWQFLFKKIYPSLSCVICLNKDEAAYFKSMGCKTAVIPNFTVKSNRLPSKHENKQLLTVGWLSKTKGADLIPAIADIVFTKYPDWTWKIAGSGDEEEVINTYQGKIELIKPSTPHIEELYMESSIYILPSRFECFPMVLLEAMSCGVPVVAFDCPTGPRHIIKNGEDGFLIEPQNTTAMAGAICSLIEEAERRKDMGTRAAQNIQRFSAENVYALWQTLLKDA